MSATPSPNGKWIPNLYGTLPHSAAQAVTWLFNAFHAFREQQTRTNASFVTQEGLASAVGPIAQKALGVAGSNPLNISNLPGGSSQPLASAQTANNSGASSGLSSPAHNAGDGGPSSLTVNKWITVTVGSQTYHIPGFQ